MKTWDIFCRVIDNYGDIGVCWRLARQLAHEHNIEVRLWVDEIAALKQIWPATTITESQVLAGIQICIWRTDFHTDYVADVVIEAFACHLPDNYITQMRQAATAPHWFNLEYLSAETWVENCHALVSMHPQNGLKKTFFFPGFSEKTGGLLREKELIEKRDAFTSSPQKHAFLNQLGVLTWPDDGLIISLFSYENSAIASLLNTWSQAPKPILCLVPAGKTLTSINGALHLQLRTGDEYTQGSLTLKIIPFLQQTDYDQLLWLCDINFVRGEDSFVRALWAAKPFVWHIYPQDDDAHLLKLNAFLDKYTETTEPALATTIKQLWHNWNSGADCCTVWNQAMNQYPYWRQHSQDECKNLCLTSDLAANLVHFCQKNL